MGTNTNGSINKTVILILGMLAIALVASRMWARHGAVDEAPQDRPEPASAYENKNPVTGDRRYTLSIPTEGQQGQASQNVWGILQELLKVGAVVRRERAVVATVLFEARGVASSDALSIGLGQA